MSYLNAEIFSIHCLTNMLAGSGKSNYGVIDQLVQRDATGNLPLIHASSLKGAIREFCTHHKMTPEDRRAIFGSAEKQEKDTQTGGIKFLDAYLLSIPVRSDKQSFVHITAPQVLQNLGYFLSVYGLNQQLQKDIETFCALAKGNAAIAFDPHLKNACLEEDKYTVAYEAGNESKMPATVKSVLPGNIVLVNDDVFSSLTNDLHLPVIARNHLENGESANLWYEQVIPRQSRFWCSLLYPAEMTGEYGRLMNLLKKPPVQIGANATVGYGYTAITSLIKN